jgi:hypothetical protein
MAPGPPCFWSLTFQYVNSYASALCELSPASLPNGESLQPLFLEREILTFSPKPWGTHPAYLASSLSESHVTLHSQVYHPEVSQDISLCILALQITP